MDLRDYGYYKTAFSGIPKPFAFLDLDLMLENSRQILQRSYGKRIRIASKSIRSVSVLKRILQLDQRFQGVMCFSPQEANFLAKQGVDDLLLGYPIWEPAQITSLARLVDDGHTVTLMVDSAEHVDHLERIARQVGVCLPLCVDIDMSSDMLGLHFGVWRSPIRRVQDGLALIKRIAGSAQLKLDGLMGYEAQIAGVGDRFAGRPLKNALVTLLKKRSIREIAARREELVSSVRSMGLPLRFVNGGGTGSLATTSQEACVTEVTAGSGFYSPTLFDHYRDFRYRPAAGFAIEIVRRPREDIFTCLGGGYIASGAVGKEKQPVPYLPHGAKLLASEGAGEVQTPVRYRGAQPLGLGDPIFFRHSKAGELCERFSHLYCLSDGKIVEMATTYRGDGQCLL